MLGERMKVTGEKIIANCLVGNVIRGLQCNKHVGQLKKKRLRA